MNSFVALFLLAIVGLSYGDGVGLGGHGVISAPGVTPVIAPVGHPVPIVAPIVRPTLQAVPIGHNWGSGLYGRGGLGLGGLGLYGRGRLGLGGLGLYDRGVGFGGLGLYGHGIGLGGPGLYGRRPLIGTYGSLYGGKYLD